jgi:hypothetical protein
VVLEVDVQPFAMRRAGTFGGSGHELGTDPGPAEAFGHHGVQDEGMGTAVPGDVDEPHEAAVLHVVRGVRPLVGWTQREGLRRLAYALRPLIDQGLGIHDIAAELHAWYLDWRPASPAAYITARLRERAV